MKRWGEPRFERTRDDELALARGPLDGALVAARSPDPQVQCVLLARGEAPVRQALASSTALTADVQRRLRAAASAADDELALVLLAANPAASVEVLLELVTVSGALRKALARRGGPLDPQVQLALAQSEDWWAGARLAERFDLVDEVLVLLTHQGMAASVLAGRLDVVPRADMSVGFLVRSDAGTEVLLDALEACDDAVVDALLPKFQGSALELVAVIEEFS